MDCLYLITDCELKSSGLNCIEMSHYFAFAENKDRAIRIGEQMLWDKGYSYVYIYKYIQGMGFKLYCQGDLPTPEVIWSYN